MELDQNVAPAAPAESAPATEQTPIPAGQEGQQPPEGAQQPQPKQPSRLQQRIDELTRQRYEEQRAREALEARLAQYERQQTTSKTFAEIDAAMPDINQFGSLVEYQRAMSDWTTRRAAAIAMQQWQEHQQKQEAELSKQTAEQRQRAEFIQRENAALEEALGEGVKKYPDFQQTLMNPELPSVRGTPLMGFIMTAENRVDIAYALAKNPGQLERLLAMPPILAAREIVKLDLKFSGGGAPNVSHDPPPNRNGSPVVQKSTANMSYAEWEKAREAELKAGR